MIRIGGHQQILIDGGVTGGLDGMYISSEGLSDSGSTMDFPLSMIEVEIIFMDVDCETGGGFDKGKTHMR